MAEQWRTDLRLAFRRLGRARGFTSAAVLTLAVGIAGVSVMFALIQLRERRARHAASSVCLAPSRSSDAC